MGVTDALWMVAIVGGAGYLFYRSFWKKQGCCQGCSNAGCSRRTLAVAGALLGCMLMSTVPASAAQPDGPGDAACPRAVVEAELFHTPAERLTAGPESSVTKHVTISGLLEVEASSADSGSSLTLATAQLGLGVRTDENFGGTLVLRAEEGGITVVDEATINFATDRWSARAGRQQCGAVRIHRQPLPPASGRMERVRRHHGGPDGGLRRSARRSPRRTPRGRGRACGV